MSSQATRATSDGRAYLDLQKLARRSGRNTQELLRLFALEGFLARLATSPHASQLVLKGGVLLAAYGSRRATRDIDLQGRYLANDIDNVLSLVREVASVVVDDGLAFQAETATAQTIRDGDTYHGIRVNLAARLVTANIGFHVDINVGDPIWPAPQRVTLPGLLGRNVVLVGYPLPMVHAEKIVTAIDRGTANTRWRDFADIYTLSGQHSAAGDELRTSIDRVAAYRKVTLAPLTDVLTGWAGVAHPKWAAWRRTQQLVGAVPEPFADVISTVEAFADPVLTGEAVGLYWYPERRAWGVPPTRQGSSRRGGNR